MLYNRHLLPVLILLLLFPRPILAEDYRTHFSVIAKDQASIYYGYGQAIGNTGRNYVMVSPVGKGRHLNSIYVWWDSSDWAEIGWYRIPDQGPKAFAAYTNRGVYNAFNLAQNVGTGQNYAFKIAADTNTSTWWWIIDNGKITSRNLPYFFRGTPLGGSEKTYGGQSNYAHWWSLQVKRSQGDYRYWLDLRKLIEFDPDGYKLYKISNSEFSVEKK